MIHNHKGAALLQILLVTVVLAGLSTMLLRASLSRSTNARQTRRAVSAQLLISSCQAEVQSIWAAKKSEIFDRDLRKCVMWCKSTSASAACTPDNSNASRSYTCTKITAADGNEYTVTATMDATSYNGQCMLTYVLTDKNGTTEVVF